MKNIYMAVAICFFICVSVFAYAQDSKKVYIVASYEMNHICGGPQEDGVIKGLNKTGWFEGLNLDVRRYYMDTKKTHTTAEAMKTQARIAMKQIAEFKPDIIVTIDDNAFREVGLNYLNDDHIKVVFSGMNAQPEKYTGKNQIVKSRAVPGYNVTGVYEKLYVVRSLKVLSSALSGLDGKKVVGITDYSPTGNAVAKQFEIELKHKPSNIDWELKRVKNWQEYKKLILALNKDDDVKAIYPVALSLKVSSKLTYSAPEIFKWTIKNSKKPEMALNYYFSKVGLFGGAAVDFKAMGFLAGKKVGAILNGVNAGDIPVEDAPDYAIVFNITRAKQLGIEIPVPLLTAADDIYE